ncbi:MAG TPA: ComF family protein [Pedobacter sp.]|nr:ComF family protein [Pedobacter sp.]
MSVIFRAFRDFFSLLFPNLCSGCSRHLNNGESAICISCLYRLPYTDHHLHAANKTARLFWGKIPFNAAMALLYFKKEGRVQKIIHSLKYKGRKETGIKLGVLMAEQLRKTTFYEDIDLVVPVPLHSSKERQRGYNQSACLAEGIAVELGITLSSGALSRTIATESQTRKGRYSRHENMHDAFSVRAGSELTGMHVLLVDDVITTGATIVACAVALHECGIKKLSIIAAASAE